MSKIKEIVFVLAAIVTIITGFINPALLKDWFEKALEYKLITGSIITGIVIVIIFVKKFSSICKFFKWLLEKYFKIIWKIIGMGRIEKTLKKEREENENKFNNAYKKIAEIYYIFARDELSAINESKNEECKNTHWLRHFMCLASFYYALTKMSKFSDNELHFIRLVEKIADKYNKSVPMPDIKFFHHFLTFIEHSEKIDTTIFEETKTIYNKLLKIFKYSKIRECIGKSEFNEERVPKHLKLAERYKDPAYLEILDSGNL